MNPAAPPILGLNREVDTEEQAYWLDVAWRALQAELPTLAARMESDPELDQLAGDVVTAAARRALRNPDGFTSESGQIDDYSESWRRADSTEDVYFTAAELRRLGGGIDQLSAGWSGSVKYL